MAICSLHFDWFCFSVTLSIYCKEKCPWWGVKTSLVCGCRDKYLHCNYRLDWFSFKKKWLFPSLKRKYLKVNDLIFLFYIFGAEDWTQVKLRLYHWMIDNVEFIKYTQNSKISYYFLPIMVANILNNIHSGLERFPVFTWQLTTASSSSLRRFDTLFSRPQALHAHGAKSNVQTKHPYM